MNQEEREAIIQAARRHTTESRQAQGLPPVVTDPDALRKVAALVARPDHKAA